MFKDKIKNKSLLKLKINKKKLNILLIGKYIKKKTGKISIYNFLKKNHTITFCEEFEDIKIKKYDYIISYGYGKILNKSQIDKLNGTIINLHMGYLPFARGIYPLVWSLIFTKPVGFTIHLISDNKIDVGPILYRKKVDYKETDNLKQIHFNCKREIEKYFISNIDKILSYKKKLNKPRSFKRYYFSRKCSNKLLYELPNKWNTKANYIKINSKILKKIYQSN